MPHQGGDAKLTDQRIYEEKELRAEELERSLKRKGLPAGALLGVVFACGFLLYFSGQWDLYLARDAYWEDRVQEFGAESGIEHLNSALKLNPRLDEARSLRVCYQMQVRNPDFAKARSDIAELLKSSPDNISYLNQCAEVEQSAHAFSNATVAQTNLIKKDAAERASHFASRAELYELQSERVKAVMDRNAAAQEYSKSILSKHDETLRIQRAGQYRYLGKINEAINDYTVCIANQPAEESTKTDLAYLYCASGQIEKALDYYNKNIPDAKVMRACLSFQIGDYSKALAHIEEAFRASPNNDELHVLHARVLKKTGRTTAANQEFKELELKLTADIEKCEIESKNKPELICYHANNYDNRGDYYLLTKQYKKALTDYLKASVISGQEYPVISGERACKTAKAYASMGDFDNATKQYNKALANAKGFYDHTDVYYIRQSALNGLAELYLLQQKPELAVDMCTMALLENSTRDDGRSNYLRAKAYREMGNYELAKYDENQMLGKGFIIPSEEIIH